MIRAVGIENTAKDVLHARAAERTNLAMLVQPARQAVIVTIHTMPRQTWHHTSTLRCVELPTFALKKYALYGLSRHGLRCGDSMDRKVLGSRDARQCREVLGTSCHCQDQR
jgi:hypothetical protein